MFANSFNSKKKKKAGLLKRTYTCIYVNNQLQLISAHFGFWSFDKK